MRILYKILLVAIIMIPVTIGACKKQPSCGCDKDVINTFLGAPVNIYYDEENNSARFYLMGNPYATYYFCNPSEMMPVLTKYAVGEEVLVDCEIFYECNYMYQAGNSPYGSMYQAYMVTVDSIYIDLYGK